jgi:2-aminoethylphosphonate-pyruvate transaminase
VADPEITHVGMVYSETGSGVIHDPALIGTAVRAANRRLIVDAVSAFGALPLDVSAMPELDVAVFTTNKCLEALPGISFSITRLASLEPGRAGSWSFDLADILAQQRRSPGSFRFTPPAQVLAALAVALDFYDREGGQAPRLARYRANAMALYDGMVAIGLAPVLDRAVQGPVILNVHAPDDTAWSLQAFVDALKRRGFLISNFFNTPQPSFRVGCIGAITPEDMRGFTEAADAALKDIGVRNRAPSRAAA